MEQNKSNAIIVHTQKEKYEILERKVNNYKEIAEQYHIQNQNLSKNNQELEIKLKFHKKISIIATSTAILLGLILIF